MAVAGGDMAEGTWKWCVERAVGLVNGAGHAQEWAALSCWKTSQIGDHIRTVPLLIKL